MFMKKICHIISIQGYEGMPERFIVSSQYGYLGADSFTDLSGAYVFADRRDAYHHLNRLYPDFSFDNQDGSDSR